MGIFAAGFGAFVTLTALENLREIDENLKLVLQNPDLSMAHTLLTMANVTEEEFHKAGRVVLGAAMKRAVEVPYSFYEELREQMLYYNHEMPMLLLHGEKDNIIPISYLEPFRQFNDQSKLVVIPGADDQFRGSGQWDTVVDLTRDWFQCEQVLLCDWI
jgi:pimeloyl-ACP methyl ester carboxylesterase